MFLAFHKGSWIELLEKKVKSFPHKQFKDSSPEKKKCKILKP